ncbi:MAG: hypothetical protein IKO78_04105 [Bacilli bacterium]|nr:hypothetical protein [Bacilli bacterium]
MENETNKKQTFAIFSVVFIIALLIGLGIGFLLFSTGNKDTNTNTNTNANTNKEDDGEKKELSEETKEELKKIAQIESGSELMSPLYGKGGFISYFEDEDKLSTIYFYALNNGLTTTVTGEETEYCSGGSGKCVAISKENFTQIAKKYGLSDFEPNLREYNGLYLFTYGGWAVEDLSVVHNYYFITTGPGVDIIDNITYKPNYPNGTERKEKREFTFHIDTDTNEYYLASAYEIHDIE